MKVEFYETIKQQIEVLPRFTILYGEEMYKGFSFEWLFFGMFINLEND